MKIDILLFLENLSKDSSFHYNETRITGPLREDFCTFMVISHWMFLRMTNISGKNCRENENTFYVQ